MGLDVPYGTYDYISKLSATIIESHQVNDGTVRLLSHFILKNQLSAYQIYKKEKTINDALEYRSVNKKVKKLLGLNLIERIKDNDQISEIDLKRNPKYYKLTEQGLFTLYIKHKTYPPNSFIVDMNSKKRVLTITLTKRTLLRYGEYDFYKFCLYPWIDQDTIAKSSQQFAKKIH